MPIKDTLSGVFLLLISVVLFLQSRSLEFWEAMGPSEGFFPLVLSLLLAGLSFTIILQAWLRSAKPSESLKIIGPERNKFYLYLGSFLLFGFFFATIGYSLMLTIFLVFILKWVERQSWKVTFGVVGVSLAVSHLIFMNLLAVPLPEGLASSFLKILK